MALTKQQVDQVKQLVKRVKHANSYPNWHKYTPCEVGVEKATLTKLGLGCIDPDGVDGKPQLLFDRETDKSVFVINGFSPVVEDGQVSEFVAKYGLKGQGAVFTSYVGTQHVNKVRTLLNRTPSETAERKAAVMAEVAELQKLGTPEAQAKVIELLMTVV